MERKTNLRALRLRYDISLMELEAISGLSNQYISRAELGDISPTSHLEERLGAAMDAVIVQRGLRLSELGRNLAACKGRLLQLEEGDPDE